MSDAVEILGTQIKLWCLEGSSSFSVIVGKDNSIFDLKKIISKEISVPDNVKPRDLRLWNVNFDEGDSPDELNDENEIKGSRNIRDIFQEEVQGNNIQVVVRVPVVTGESYQI
jgi:hypothetical protein